MPLVLGIGLVLSGNGCAHQADTGRKDSGQAEAQDRSGEGTVVQEIEDLRSNADVRISEEDSASQWTRDEGGEALYEEDARDSADGGETESEGDGGRAPSEDPVVCQPGMVFLRGSFCTGRFRLRSISTAIASMVEVTVAEWNACVMQGV